MQPRPADLLGPGRDEAKPDLRRVTRHHRAAGLRADLPAEQPSPEGRRGERVDHVEPHRFQSHSHLGTVGQPRGRHRRTFSPIHHVAPTTHRDVVAFIRLRLDQPFAAVNRSVVYWRVVGNVWNGWRPSPQTGYPSWCMIRHTTILVCG